MYTINDLGNGSYIIKISILGKKGQIYCDDERRLNDTVKDLEKFVGHSPEHIIYDIDTYWENGWDMGKVFEAGEWWI